MSDPRQAIQPVIVPIRPLTAGKDVSQPPQDINPSGASDLMNVRFHYGQLMMRNGFKVKYQGADEPAMAIIRAEDTEGSMVAMTMIGAENVWQTESSANIFQKMKLVKVGTIQGKCNSANNYLTEVSDADIDKIYPGSKVAATTYLTGGQTVSYVDKTAHRVYLSAVANGTNASLFTITISEKVTLTADWTSDLVLWTRGTGVYQPWNINAAVEYPATGYADIIVWTNRVDGVFVMIPASDGDPMACELLEDDDSVGLAGARAVAVYGNRLIIGGTSDNPAQIVWSAPDQFDDFSLVGGGGSVLFGDTTSPIQNMVPLGDYLIIYCEKSIWIMRKTGQANNPFMFEIMPSQGIGLAAPLSVTIVKDYHIFLGWDGAYKLSTSGIEPISIPVRDEILGRTGGQGIVPEHINRCFGVHVEAFNEYWLFTPTGSYSQLSNWIEAPVGKMLYVHAGTFVSGNPLVATTDTNIDTMALPGYRISSAASLAGSRIFKIAVNQDFYMDTAAYQNLSVPVTINPYFANSYWVLSLTASTLVTTHAGGPFTGQYLRFDNT